jgi:hypothetical protein
MNCSYLKNPSQNFQTVNSIFYYLVFKKFSNYFLFAANIFLIILFHMYCIVRSSRLLLLYSSLFSFFSSSFLSIYMYNIFHLHLSVLFSSVLSFILIIKPTLKKISLVCMFNSFIIICTVDIITMNKFVILRIIACIYSPTEKL